MQNRQTKFSRRHSAAGFSLVELLVTLAVFLVIAGAAFSLATKHVPVFTAQQNQAGLNFSLRNAAAQMQIDTANAGSGFYPSADVTSWPVAVAIQPGSDDKTDCHNASTFTYSQTCFDTLIVLKADPKAPPAQIDPNGGQTCQPSIARSSELWVNPVGTTTAAQLASAYKTGDQILLISAANGGNTITTAILTKDGSVSGGKVKLQHNPTGANGTNTSDNDHYLISTTANNKLGEGFCAGDWVVKLSPSVYTVDASDSSNPKLVRLHPDDPNCQPGSVAPYNGQCVVAEQIIGFKVGAQIFDPDSTLDATDCKPYCYRPDSYSKDWSQIRAVRMTIIGRTTPNSDPSSANAFKNTFDQGPYRIDAISIVVSPRTLSMRDES